MVSPADQAEKAEKAEKATLTPDAVPLQSAPEQAGGGVTAEQAKAGVLEAPALSPKLLAYLKEIANGSRELGELQLREIRGQSDESGKTDDPPATAGAIVAVAKEADIAGQQRGGEEKRRSLLGRNDKVPLNALLDYLTSVSANALALPPTADLSWPISSYFISSSHNTYLTGNQLYGDASTVAYKNVS